MATLAIRTNNTITWNVSIK